MLYKAKEVLGKATPSESEISFLREFVQEFLKHASDCEGTTLLAEALPEGKVSEFGEQLIALRSEGKPLTVYKGIATRGTTVTSTVLSLPTDFGATSSRASD
ncbi:MAG: hypothetical protein ACUVSC_13345, partial [Candidatus Fervidibacter sp.]